MDVIRGRAAVIGGSIAGCAAALALTRAGCDVTVFESTSGTLRDRGVGIGLPPTLLEQFTTAGYLDAGLPGAGGRERVFFLRDGEARAGRVTWRQRLPIHLTNWSVLWQSLHRRTADCDYRSGTTATVVAADGSGVTISANGAQERFDLAIGADGNGSAVHRLVSPEPQAQLPGYGLWRGTYPEDLLPDGAADELEDVVAMVCFPGGHAVIYLIPDHQDTGRRLVNWGIYLTPPTAFTNGAHIPPGRVPEPLLDAMDATVTAHFPPLWAELVTRTEPGDIAVQPVIDLPAARYTSGRLALAGDAGTTARPHTASGSVKALQDAIALEAAARSHQDLGSALADYGRERCSAGDAIVQLGRTIGRAQVEATPDWGAMSAAAYEAWWDAATTNQVRAYDW